MLCFLNTAILKTRINVFLLFFMFNVIKLGESNDTLMMTNAALPGPNVVTSAAVAEISVLVSSVILIDEIRKNCPTGH